ncbi:hypothetical protein BLSTO_02744 [Blastocystis sp. subtype 1]
MRGLASTDKRLENSGIMLFNSVCVLFVFGDICFCIGLFLALFPDKRIQKISETTCTLRCNTVGGRWNTSDYACHVTGYLASLCLRVRKSANATQWAVDTPPSLRRAALTRSFQPLAGSQVAEGCAYRAANNLLNYASDRRWEPLLYTAQPRSHLHLAVRHAADALIRADSITRGCSGNAVGDAQCFGVGKAQYKWVTWLALSVGGVTLVLEAVGGVMYWKGQFSVEHLGKLFARSPSTDNDTAVVDLPLEEKAPFVATGERDSISVPKKISFTEENLSAVQAEDPYGRVAFAPFVSSYSLGEGLQKEGHDDRFEPSYGESNYEGCEEGI